MSEIFYKLIKRIDYYLDKYIFVPKYFPNMSKDILKFNVLNIQDTAKKLLNSNNSLARFGDGEIKWLLNIDNSHSFEKNSKLLSNRLKNILQTNHNNFMIGLPDGFTLNKNFVNASNFFWKQFMIKYGLKFFSYLNENKKYYNTSVTRPYIDYNTRNIAKETFKIWKKIWKNRNILIVEGKQTRLGVGDDLFEETKTIKRIECPSVNAFESYNEILKYSLDFLDKHKKDKYITLISLGPSATILAYDLFKNGYRTIDIGHIDLEYEWYLMGAKEKIDLPYKYVNETPDGHYALPISSKQYNNEIIYDIK